MVYVFLNMSYLHFSSLQVISLGDIIKFSVSPSKTKDSLSTNVSGVPLDDRNLVLLFPFSFFSSSGHLFVQTSENVMWKFSFNRLLRRLTFIGRRLAVTSSFGYEATMSIMFLIFSFLIKSCMLLCFNLNSTYHKI